MTTVVAEVPEAAVKKWLSDMVYDLASKGMKKAVKDGAKVVEDSYRSVLLSHEKKPQGKNFLHAWDALDTKVALYSSGFGAYAVVGVKIANGQRLAPQVLWGEKGTKLRKTKRGLNRGTEPPQHWMQIAIARAGTSPQETALRSLEQYAAKYRS